VRVFAVVPNWNGGDELMVCLESLAQLEPPLEGVVLVDNGSNDGSVERAAAVHPSLFVMRNEHNLGFGEACNQGARRALEWGADACLLVNNDAVLMRDTLELLVRAMQADPGLGVAGPRILLKGFEPVERLWSAGGMLTWRQNLTTLVGHFEPDHPRWRCTVPVDYVTGCVMLVRREVYEAVGFIDPEYFAYMEDVDFCLRAAEAGFRCACVGGAVAYHRGSASTGVGYTIRRKYMMGVNSVWFLRRFGGPRQWVRFVAFDVLSLPAAWLVGVALGRAGAVLAKAKGILDGLAGAHVQARVVEDGRALWRPRRGERRKAA
jgi:GT2 family glycosyltransferase